MFERDVNSDGGQTAVMPAERQSPFERDVNSDGGQTATKDILDTASKTNTDVNKEFGLQEEIT